MHRIDQNEINSKLTSLLFDDPGVMFCGHILIAFSSVILALCVLSKKYVCDVSLLCGV
jgi:hypothetical protein